MFTFWLESSFIFWCGHPYIRRNISKQGKLLAYVSHAFFLDLLAFSCQQLSCSKRSVAEECDGHKLGGLKVLNSYWLNEFIIVALQILPCRIQLKYCDVILVDAAHKAICNDPWINWICKPVHQHKELPGLTSAGINTEVCTEMDTCTTRQELQGGQHGRGTTPSLRHYR
ncbi:Ribosomal protein L15e [Dillenia turbinata]|uniref:Ribosomal protein L15 n=1 Tax=Dillenia turbinata TaxID=194707 RepID=A0AAN8V0P7_9MAGN